MTLPDVILDNISDVLDVNTRYYSLMTLPDVILDNISDVLDVNTRY